MSFVHYVRVGYYGVPEESQPQRDLTFEETLELVKQYDEIAPDDLRVEPETAPRPSSRETVVARASGRPISLRSGVLLCPYLDSEYVYPAIGFAAYVQKVLGCSIYSDDEGRMLSLDEFIPTKSFSQLMSEALDRHGVPLEDVLRRAEPIA